VQIFTSFFAESFIIVLVPENISRLRVVVVWPSDVLAEREVLEQIIGRVNQVADPYGLQLYLRFWPKHVPPGVHADGPQSLVEKALRIAESDIVIAILWKRWGTPVPGAQSGTEHELMLAYEGWKKKKQPQLIMHYFRKPDGAVNRAEDAEQLMQVLRYKERVLDTLYGEYEDVQDFERIVYNNLVQVVQDWNVEERRPSETKRSAPEIEPNQDWENLKSQLYTFCGYTKELRDSDVIQDFKVERRQYRNPNPVSHLWADAYKGSWIRARVAEMGGPHLEVSFENTPDSWPCSLAIRPIRERAVTTRGRKRLAFEAQVSPETPMGEVTVAVRVVNGWYQHWIYGAGPNTNIPEQITETPRTIEIPLDARDLWWLFPNDGNRFFGPPEFDYSIIASVILHFGGHAHAFPGPGRATVQIRNVHLK
jgi:hypothetical protein